MNLNEIIMQSWKNFLITVSFRLNRIHEKYPLYALSEETFRLDYSLEISKLIGDSTEVFAEFPCDKLQSQKWDIFFAREQGICIELKFLRPIPSGRNPPFPQHFGAVISDLLKLKLLADKDRKRYIILIADDKFCNHLINQGLPLSRPGEERLFSVNLNDLQSTAKKEINKRLKNVEIPFKSELNIKTVEREVISPFTFHLIVVE